MSARRTERRRLDPVDLSALSDIFAPSEFAAPASADIADAYTDALILMLADGGPELVSMAAVARYRNQVPSAVTQRIGGRQAFLDVVVRCFAARWLRWASRPRLAGTPALRLSRTDDELHGVRVWRVLREVVEGEARAGRRDLAEHLAEVDARERAALAHQLAAMAGRSPSPAELTLLHCLGRGLRGAMADYAGALTTYEAEEALDLALHLLGFDIDDAEDRPVGM